MHCRVTVSSNYELDMERGAGKRARKMLRTMKARRKYKGKGRVPQRLPMRYSTTMTESWGLSPNEVIVIILITCIKFKSQVDE